MVLTTACKGDYTISYKFCRGIHQQNERLQQLCDNIFSSSTVSQNFHIITVNFFGSVQCFVENYWNLQLFKNQKLPNFGKIVQFFFLYQYQITSHVKCWTILEFTPIVHFQYQHQTHSRSLAKWEQQYVVTSCKNLIHVYATRLLHKLT